MKKVYKDGRAHHEKKLVDNLMTKFKAIESKTQSLQYYTGKLFG
jgi:hypothetical protein